MSADEGTSYRRNALAIIAVGFWGLSIFANLAGRGDTKGARGLGRGMSRTLTEFSR